MLVMVVFFIAFRWIHLSTPLIRLFLLVLILLLMPTLNFLPVWFALSLLRFRLPSRLPMIFIHCIQMDTSVNAANQVVSVGADIACDADPKFFACLVRFESSSVPTTLFFQAEDDIRDGHVTGVQTCALPISFPAGVTTGSGR